MDLYLRKYSKRSSKVPVFSVFLENLLRYVVEQSQIGGE